MATLVETTDVSAAQEALSGIYGIRKFTAPAAGIYLRIDQDQFGLVGLHHTDFMMECGIDSSPIRTYFFNHLARGNRRYHRDDEDREGRAYGAGDVFLALRPEITWHGDIDGADLESVSISPELLTRVASTQPSRRPLPLQFTSYQPVAAEDARGWRSTLSYARSLALTGEVALSPLLAGATGRLLAATALTVFPNNALTDPTIEDRHDAHPATVRRAVAFIDEHAGQDITVADIAAAAFVTIRAVQLAFRRHLDTTPMEYLRRVRLEHAHHDLLAADPATTTVTEVAYRWGFPTVSRFAVYYRRAYGITPSQTLRG